MKITNNAGLPQAIVEAVRLDDYDPGDCDISVSALIGPPQIRQLRVEYEDKITEDAVDRVWALLGKAVHVILERAAIQGTAEERLFADMNGYTVSGQLDHIGYQHPRLTDYKVTSAWTHIHGPRQDWIHQLNTYAWLARQNGLEVEELQIVAIYRDWSAAQARRNADYPQVQVARVEIPVWPDEDAEEYVAERLAMHFGDIWHFCTDEERWAKEEQWAVMREGRKSALRVLNSKEQALIWAEEHGHVTVEMAVVNGEEIPVSGTWSGGHYLQERPREYVRCEGYCSVAPFCSQWQADLKAREESD